MARVLIMILIVLLGITGIVSGAGYSSTGSSGNGGSCSTRNIARKALLFASLSKSDPVGEKKAGWLHNYEKTDITAAGLTVKKSRQAVIDFLQPYLRSGIRIAVNIANGVLGTYPTFDVTNFPSITGFLSSSKDPVYKAAFESAKSANRLVTDEAGIAALLASSSPAALIRPLWPDWLTRTLIESA